MLLSWIELGEYRCEWYDTMTAATDGTPVSDCEYPSYVPTDAFKGNDAPNRIRSKLKTEGKSGRES